MNIPVKMPLLADDGRLSTYWTAYFDSIGVTPPPGHSGVLTANRLFNVQWVVFLTRVGKRNAPFQEPVIYDNGIITLPWLIFFNITTAFSYPALTEAAIPASTNASEHTLLDSPLAFIESAGLSSPFSNSSTEYSYSQILTEAANLATRFPSLCKLETILTLPSGNKVMTLRVRDTGSNPLVLVACGIHGNEISGVPGTLRFALEYALGSSPSLSKMVNTVGLVIILSVNADGMVADTRANANGINLNRNWPWFWELEDDTDKGATASSELETAAIEAWSIGLSDRVYICVDTHGWTSQTTWGFLTEEVYWHQEAELSHRRAYHYINNLARKRDWSTFTVANASPVLTEYKSHEKPYLYNWFRNRGDSKAVGFLIEYPETENSGLVATFMMDVVHGAIMTAYDIYGARRISGHEVTPGLSVVNSNPDFSGWNTPENRPDFFSYSRCSLLNHAGNTFDLSPYYSNGWPITIRSSAIEFSSGYALSVAGVSATGTQALCYLMGTDGAITPSNTYPINSQEHATATDGTTIWSYGGIDETTTYIPGLYAKSLAGTDAWALVANVTLGGVNLAIQRHKMVYYAGFLYVIGGRTAAAISKSVYKINVTTGVAVLLVDMPANTQRHTVALSGNLLYVFGGDAGATIRTTIYKVNLATGTASTLAATLPVATTNATAVNSATTAYIAFGNTDIAGTAYSSAISTFNFSTEACASLSYALDSFVNDEGTTVYVTDPLIGNGSGYYDSVTSSAVFVGGIMAGGLSDIVWELNGLTLSTRGSVFTEHSYIRSTQAFSTVTDEEYVMVSNVTSNSAMNDTGANNVTPALITGQLSAPFRVVDSVRRVPSFSKTPLFMALKIRSTEAGASALRMYVRFWHSGRSIKVTDGMQLLKCASSKAVAAFGLIAGTSKTEVSFSSSAMQGIFSPFWGAKSPVNQIILDFGTFQLWYISTDSDAVAPNGYFQLQWTGGTHNFPVVELNHGKSVQEWRRDSISWKVTPGTTFSLWFYGNIYSHTMPVSYPSAYTANGSGILIGLS